MNYDRDPLCELPRESRVQVMQDVLFSFPGTVYGLQAWVTARVIQLFLVQAPLGEERVTILREIDASNSFQQMDICVRSVEYSRMCAGRVSLLSKTHFDTLGFFRSQCCRQKKKKKNLCHVDQFSSKGVFQFLFRRIHTMS